MRKKINAVALLGLLVVTGGAVAAKPAPKSSINLVVVASSGGPSAPAAAAEPSYGGQITFDVSTTETDQPSVNVRCYQDGTWVYDGWQAFWAGYPHAPIFTLSSNYWTSGPADCTARLVYVDRRGLVRELTSMGFHVAA
jgi:hypothetical protein